MPTNDLVTFSNDIDRVDWNSLASMFERASVRNRDAASLEAVFRSSGSRCFVFVSDELIGAGRALTDFSDYAFVLDVVVAPEYQGRGVGREIMGFLASSSAASNLVLHALPDKQPFYAKLGYRKLKTAMALFEQPSFWRERGHVD